MAKEIKKGDVVICETASSVYAYHLRVVGPEGPKMGGGAPDALCGKKVGWDTSIPLSAYGIRDHLPSHWCKKCLELALEKGAFGAEDKAQRTLLRSL